MHVLDEEEMHVQVLQQKFSSVEVQVCPTSEVILLQLLLLLFVCMKDFALPLSDVMIVCLLTIREAVGV